MTIHQEVLETLVCPQCRGDLKLTEQGDGLVCEACRLLYEIQDDIPVMIIEKAKKLP